MGALTFFAGFDCWASEDVGLTWAKVFTAESPILGLNTDLSAGFDGAYLIVGTSVSAFSSDAVSWVETAAPAGTITKLLYNGSVFVALAGVAQNSYVASPPVASWSGPHALPFNPVVSGVIGTTFVLLGPLGIRATSSDGITWSTSAGGPTGATTAHRSATSFNRNRVVTSRAADNGPLFYTATTTGWASSTPVPIWESSRVGVDGDGTYVVTFLANSNTARQSADGGATWSGSIPLTTFVGTAPPLWLGEPGTFIIPVTATGTPKRVGVRTTDGGASWALQTQTFDPDFSMTGLGHVFYLPDGLPVDPEAFWTHRIKTSEVI